GAGKWSVEQREREHVGWRVYAAIVTVQGAQSRIIGQQQTYLDRLVHADPRPRAGREAAQRDPLQPPGGRLAVGWLVGHGERDARLDIPRAQAQLLESRLIWWHVGHTLSSRVLGGAAEAKRGARARSSLSARGSGGRRTAATSPC